MVSNDPRIDALERSIIQLSERVGEVVKYMERLVVIEERNSFMAEQHKELKESFKEAIGKLETQNSTLEKKVRELQEKMVSLMTIFSGITAVVAIVAPYVLKSLMGG